MIDRAQLLSDLQGLVRKLEDDLQARTASAEVSEVEQALKAEYKRAKDGKRTAQSYSQWVSDYKTQVAVAWVLSATFARFLEDNELVSPPRLSGVGDNLQRARDEHELYFRQHPTESDRNYLLWVFEQLAALPAAAEIFGQGNLLWEIPNWLSGDAAGAILKFFQTIDPETGALVHDFTDRDWDTRFLGDLYQDLSESARKKYALLQTPIFVEEFILERTLEPALDEFQAEFQAEQFRMIDPACGSGHFLLGAFERLLGRWLKREPGTNSRVLAQRALNAVHGVDVNPYAVAITRFRLLLAALKASDLTKLKNTPDFKLNLACGDSLLHGEGSQLVMADWAPLAHHFQVEDIDALNRILVPGNYHAVVANPPYITPKDRALNTAYRDRYEACYMKYSLAVPFMERIFKLAVKGGFTGQITANSFMKREFGKKLIEEFFPKVDLTHVIDTSGAYIPEHGTPTVILFGRNREPVAPTIRTVMGIRGEPSIPDDPSQALVWLSILKQVGVEGTENEFISSADLPRELFNKHPWALSGGGAIKLKEFLEKTSIYNLKAVVTSIGYASFPGLDDPFVADHKTFLRHRIQHNLIKSYIDGEVIRDWSSTPNKAALTPFGEKFSLLKLEPNSAWGRWLWKMRTSLENVKSFGGKTRKQQGDDWWSWYRWIPSKYQIPLSIAFANVATHNQFTFGKSNYVYNGHSPVIKMSMDASVDDHLALLGLLNSSTACFWMKQVMTNKGNGGIGGGIGNEQWEPRYEIDGSKLKSFPLAETKPTARALKLQIYADTLLQYLPEYAAQKTVLSQRTIEEIKDSHADILALMISLQEELDWHCYKLYGLLEDLTYPSEPPRLNLGERTFEIVMARKMAAGELETTWFERHRSTPITELPDHWPDDYKKLVERRIKLIETDKNIGLIEQPEYKRRWNTEPWESQLERALQNWLLTRLESYFDLDGRMNDAGTPTAQITEPKLISTTKLADIASKDPEFMQVGELYTHNPAFSVLNLVNDLVDQESVPLLPTLRYKVAGLRKRQDWEQTWQLQRQEDTIDARTQLPKDDPNYLNVAEATILKEKEVGTIPVPPKYKSSDFQKTHYWKLRGKLDVPKERWISFPHCEDTDGQPIIAWAGYDHLQLALAISSYFVHIKEEVGGSGDPRLIPLLGCLIELLPWLKQWHNERDPVYDLKMGDYIEGFIQDEARQLNQTSTEIRAWDPPKKTSKRRR